MKKKIMFGSLYYVGQFQSTLAITLAQIGKFSNIFSAAASNTQTVLDFITGMNHSEPRPKVTPSLFFSSTVTR